jgi:hypothetical protein
MLARVRDVVDVGPGRRARIKGVSAPLTVYPLVGLRASDRAGTENARPECRRGSDDERPVLSA